MSAPARARFLVVAEHGDGQLKNAAAATVGFAREAAAAIGGDYEILVLGSGIGAVANAVTHYGAARVLMADAPALQHAQADNYAHVIAGVARACAATHVVAAASTFSKDILPRTAALLDAGMLSDAIGFRAEAGELVFRRVMFAGNVIATVKLAGARQVLTVRAAAFGVPQKTAESSPIEAIVVEANALPSPVTFISRETRVAVRPDPTEARVVVSGGRALRNGEDFERLVGGLADTLGAAVGSSRALVDAGIAPNSLQVGQTGKVVAPELYIALGISGAIQHLAGMKDAKFVAAINKDPDAPIFEVADYGLVADIYEAVPELIAKLKT